MAEVTSPDSIAKWTNADAASLVQESQTQGDSIQAAFNKRQRYEFVWANDAARTAQTGMVEGSLGYQIDTTVEYIYRNSQWRIYSALMQAYEPSFVNLNIGTTNSNLNAYFTVAAGWASAFISIRLGTGFSVSGDIYITGPVMAPVNATILALGVIKLGYANFEDVSAGFSGRFEGTVLAVDNVGGTGYPQGIFRIGGITGSPAKFDPTSATTPFTWAAGDKLHITASYPVQL